ncbi:DNA-processing protein DprA [Ciceribacter sp. L1K22]|uniref:DNA-processing protein DprA n=1 Tax=Ciceribacter sp. L1K22 TaxID=2820275 RepID=UPI001ABE842F|nr:DNA-processing protein DprA [Ciceribacter sp. L1K22]MBO3759860.1 DNA-processing protein DprA [Ciceribacter sp. L1K22]
MAEVGAGRTGIALTDRQRIAWLRLIRSDNVGPATFRDLINHFGSAERALDMLPELSKRGGSARPIRIASVSEAERELDLAHRFGARFLGIGEPGYPSALRQIEAAPPLLAVKGNLEVASQSAVGIVGSRNASISGAKFAAMIARDVGRAGYSIVSGLARGIDAAAHTASLDTGTIAALAGGIDQPYPPENLRLFDEICDRGLAVSEMPFGWEARARDFPRRNRLIAGIALGTVVVEAAARSGSLITARLAADFGRLVFAVPGSPLDPRCQGTNGLLKDGATVTTSAADVIDALAPVSALEVRRQSEVEEPVLDGEDRVPSPPEESDRTRIVDALGPTPVEVDDIIRHTGIGAASVYLVLLELDIAGRLHRHPGGLVSLAMGD